MILNVIRYRTRSGEDFHTWKFTQASGRLGGYLCVQGPKGQLAELAVALTYAITGELGRGVAMTEVALQLSDDGGP